MQVMLLNEVLPHPAETPYIGSADATSAAKARCPTRDFQKLSFCSVLSGNDGERPVRATPRDDRGPPYYLSRRRAE
jgi:hypothetical protein